MYAIDFALICCSCWYPSFSNGSVIFSLWYIAQELEGYNNAGHRPHFCKLTLSLTGTRFYDPIDSLSNTLIYACIDSLLSTHFYYPIYYLIYTRFYAARFNWLFKCLKWRFKCNRNAYTPAFIIFLNCRVNIR